MIKICVCMVPSSEYQGYIQITSSIFNHKEFYKTKSFKTALKMFRENHNLKYRPLEVYIRELPILTFKED